MRIVLVGSLTGIGGTERHLASLVRELPKRGFQVELITAEDGPLAELARWHAVKSTVFPRRGRLGYFFRLFRHLSRVRPDVVHAHSGRLPCLAARFARVPWILDTRHGLLDPGLAPEPSEGGDVVPSGKRRWRWRLEGIKGRLAHLTLTVCQADADSIAKWSGLPRARLRIVYNGIPVGPAGDLTSSRDDGCLGWVGRMADQKAPERVLDVLVGLLADPEVRPERRERLRLQMVGDGPLRPELETRVKKLGLEGRVEFLGPLPDPAKVMARWQAVLLPSRREGLPYVLLESLAVGTPVVATPVGGIGEVLTGDLAPYVVPWDLPAWVRTVAGLLGDERDWARIHAATLARIEAFSEEEMVERIAAIYREGAHGC